MLKIRDENGNIIHLPALKGADGKSAYQYAVEAGFTGTEEEFIELLINSSSTIINHLSDSSAHTDIRQLITQIQNEITNINDNIDDLGDDIITHNKDTESHNDIRQLITQLKNRIENINDSIDVSGDIETHNKSTTAHADIRQLITNLTSRFDKLADSDDTTLDQFSELIAYIKSNRSLIESITTNKVNVSDIINNLTSTATNKPLSAKQGSVLKGLIDALQTQVDNIDLSSVEGGLTSKLDAKFGQVRLLTSSENLNNVTGLGTYYSTTSVSSTLSNTYYTDTYFIMNVFVYNSYIVQEQIRVGIAGKRAFRTYTGSSWTDWKETVVNSFTASRALVSNSDGKIAVSTVTSTELGYLDGVTSNIQTQLDKKFQYVRVLTENENLDNVTSIGLYKATTTVAATLSNTYYVNAFLMSVYYGGGYIIQEQIRTGVAGKRAFRVYTSSSWTEWKEIPVNSFTASRALISSADGKITTSAVTSTELGYLDGVTSNIQTQLDNKLVNDFTASRALVSNSSGKVAVSAVTSTELGYLDGVTSNIQTQLDNTLKLTGGTVTGKVTSSYAGAGGFTVSHGSEANCCFSAKRTDTSVECRVGLSSAGNIGLWGTNNEGSIKAILYRKPTDTSDTTYIAGRIVMSGAYGTSAPPTTGTLVKGMVYFQIV